MFVEGILSFLGMMLMMVRSWLLSCKVLLMIFLLDCR